MKTSQQWYQSMVRRHPWLWGVPSAGVSSQWLTVQAAARHYFRLHNKKDSLSFLVDFKGAVLDSEIRELLEYWYFVCEPMYANYCGHSFENMIGCLTQSIPGRNNGTDNIFVINTKDILDERWKEVARTRIVCNEQPWKAEITSYPVINENIRKMCCKVQQYSG